MIHSTKKDTGMASTETAEAFFEGADEKQMTKNRKE